MGLRPSVLNISRTTYRNASRAARLQHRQVTLSSRRKTTSFKASQAQRPWQRPLDQPLGRVAEPGGVHTAFADKREVLASECEDAQPRCLVP